MPRSRAHSLEIRGQHGLQWQSLENGCWYVTRNIRYQSTNSVGRLELGKGKLLGSRLE